MAKKKNKGRVKSKKRGQGGFRLKSIFSRPVLTIILCAALAAGAAYGLRCFFLSSRFFAIKEISVTSDRGETFTAGRKKLERLYLGRNIFSVDLNQTATLIVNEFPQFRKVEVRRRLPEVLEVDIVNRRPAARIHSGGVVIDKEGVVLAAGEKDDGLVTIRGLNFFLNVPSRGTKIRDASLEKGLILISGLNRKMSGRKDSIEYIDVADKKNLILGISGVTVKMGADDLAGKIDKLNDMLADPNVDIDDINYIDMRFDEPVMSLKTEKGR